jgi:hypothetical protein
VLAHAPFRRRGAAERIGRADGHRDLRDVDLPEAHIVIVDPACEGTAIRIDTEETCQITPERCSCSGYP